MSQAIFKDMEPSKAPALYNAMVGKSESVRKSGPSPFYKVRKFKHTDQTREEGQQILKNLHKWKLTGSKYEQVAYELDMNVMP